MLPVGRRLIYATHGHIYHVKNLPPLAPGDVLLHGHTHVPAWTEFGQGNLYLNPGSVSIPKENSPHSYRHRLHPGGAPCHAHRQMDRSGGGRLCGPGGGAVHPVLRLPREEILKFRNMGESTMLELSAI